ncbi:hypothetical protein ACTQ49_06500 [Luteococcus sp. Sow4_B9]|uniref:hypothetical protein n=1 Tax=Luteococcus sp. Sow4_B9 TaxID=3438792 RepID=UPI003F972E37
MGEELNWDNGTARLRAESEQTQDLDYPSDAKVARPNRAKVYSVRLSAEEQARIEAVAQARHLPTSTLVPSWILDRLDEEKIS